MSEEPGWLSPSMKTGTVIAGRYDCSEIVCGPLTMSKETVFAGPVEPSKDSMTCRSVPASSSAALLTVNEASKRRGSSNSRWRYDHSAHAGPRWEGTVRSRLMDVTL